MIEREFDEATGLVHVRGTGAWSFKDIEEHFTALRALIADVRAAARSIRVISDVSFGHRQAAWVEEYILDQMARTFRSGDRVAFIAASQADVDHLRSLATGVDVGCFTSGEAAEQWLRSDRSGLSQDRRATPG